MGARGEGKGHGVAGPLGSPASLCHVPCRRAHLRGEGARRRLTPAEPRGVPTRGTGGLPPADARPYLPPPRGLLTWAPRRRDSPGPAPEVAPTPGPPLAPPPRPAPARAARLFGSGDPRGRAGLGGAGSARCR